MTHKFKHQTLEDIFSHIFNEVRQENTFKFLKHNSLL